MFVYLSIKLQLLLMFFGAFFRVLLYSFVSRYDVFRLCLFVHGLSQSYLQRPGTLLSCMCHPCIALVGDDPCDVPCTRWQLHMHMQQMHFHTTLELCDADEVNRDGCLATCRQKTTSTDAIRRLWKGSWASSGPCRLDGQSWTVLSTLSCLR